MICISRILKHLEILTCTVLYCNVVYCTVAGVQNSDIHKKCSWHVILRPTIEESEREAVDGWCVLNLSCVLKSLKLLYIDGVVLEHLYY